MYMQGVPATAFYRRRGDNPNLMRERHTRSIIAVPAGAAGPDDGRDAATTKTHLTTSKVRRKR
jgi:hypothetical protein